jgi:arylsulfatase
LVQGWWSVIRTAGREGQQAGEIDNWRSQKILLEPQATTTAAGVGWDRSAQPDHLTMEPRAMKRLHLFCLVLAATVAAACAPAPVSQQAAPAPGAVDRSVLPLAEPTYPPITELDARNAKAPARFEPTAPAGAPNVVIVLIDDIGFGHSSAFGGPINMPTLERLAANGLKYNRFHTTALCSPTRTALLTGYNHHSNNAGTIMEIATAFPGQTGVRPQSITPTAQVLRMNGYSTAAFGKYHETPPWEGSVSGPYDRWPTGSGFDKFYGFIGGETNQWHPMVYDGTTRVYPDVDATRPAITSRRT